MGRRVLDAARVSVRKKQADVLAAFADLPDAGKRAAFTQVPDWIMRQEYGATPPWSPQ